MKTSAGNELDVFVLFPCLTRRSRTKSISLMKVQALKEKRYNVPAGSTDEQQRRRHRGNAYDSFRSCTARCGSWNFARLRRAWHDIRLASAPYCLARLLWRLRVTSQYSAPPNCHRPSRRCVSSLLYRGHLQSSCAPPPPQARRTTFTAIWRLVRRRSSSNCSAPSLSSTLLLSCRHC